MYFTMTSDSQEISFLDIRLKLEPDQTISTNVFRKPTAGNSLLHASSFHPTSVKMNIPYSQYLHLTRICSNPKEFDQKADRLYLRLRERGYSKGCLQRTYNIRHS